MPGDLGGIQKDSGADDAAHDEHRGVEQAETTDELRLGHGSGQESGSVNFVDLGIAKGHFCQPAGPGGVVQ